MHRPRLLPTSSELQDKYDGVVFDMDGTLIDSECHYCAAYVHAVVALGGSLTKEDYFSRIAGTGADQGEATLLKGLPDHVTQAELQITWKTEYRRLKETEGFPLMTGAAELVSAFRELEFSLAVASAAPLHEIEESLDRAGVREHLPVLASGEEVTHSKPAPDVYELAAERLGIDPSRCLAFEDTNTGARAAIAAGLYTVMVSEHSEPDSHVRQHAKGIAKSLVEIVEELRA